MQSYHNVLGREVQRLLATQFTLNRRDPHGNCVAGEQDLDVPVADVSGFLRYGQFNSVREGTSFVANDGSLR